MEPQLQRRRIPALAREERDRFESGRLEAVDASEDNRAAKTKGIRRAASGYFEYSPKELRCFRRFRAGKLI